MGRFKKYEIGKNCSVQIDLGSYLDEGHLSKQIEAVVWDLDTSLLERSYSSKGQNAFNPKMLLSIIFYGYSVGLRSGRKLATACREHLAFIYLSKGYQPSKSVLNDFRKLHYRHFSHLFEQVLGHCLSEGLGDPSLSIVDGSKLRANSAKRRTKDQTQYEKWRAELELDIGDLEAVQSRQTQDVEKQVLKKN